MAFIDKIGEKISQGAASVSNSTKKMTDTARIKSMISANNQEINKRMTQIGMCVKARCLNKIDDEEVLQLASEIDSIISNNEQLSEELKRLSGIVRCANCGREIQNSVVYCPACGAKNIPPQPSEPAQTQDTSACANDQGYAEPVFCTNCGYKETGGSVFCPNCGTKLKR